MNEYIYQIYDKIFKKILTLSSGAVICLINGLFETDYPLDSEIQYNWTEFENDELKRTLADTIITIKGYDSYHMEAQMTKEDGIVLRVFDYGYSHANRHYYVEDDVYVLPFPTPVIIYLAEGEMPEAVTMRLECKDQESFTYRVNTVNYLKMTREELEDKNMIILIPFQLIRMRKIMEKERSAENLDLLKNIIQNDILGSIRRNFDVGNITEGDERKLRRLTHLLYEYLYAHYDEMEELNEMTDESLMLDIDIIEKEHERQIKEVKEEVTKEVTEKVTEEVTEKVTGRVARLTKEILRLTAQHDSTSEIAAKLGVTEEQVNEILDA